ncbi:MULTISPECIES: YbjN domain-containing protein [unclassified Anabaena]|uniref:YbjN domain-containing protein n=1 Tax=unclassified Anabaena TaxID=2619674 RepID=UPI001447411A|nr:MULTISPECIES: YbjN domain-containing protein [unclassified Anabaena]MTJ09805.1 YbjN domain-containing protein [Anabaena sp. UHCC 0204]MTJ53370.1 YbjN domain-containing protein [Anabaena sp. UHCC 0253]
MSNTEQQSSTNTSENKGLQALKTLGNFLDIDGWNPQYLEDKQAYKINFESEHGRGLAYAQIFTDIEQFLFYVMMPFKIPEESRNTIAEFITRANYGLRVGNFEMDYEDGEVRYKTCIDFGGETLTNGYIKNTMYPGLKTMERYLPGFLSIVYGGKTPEEAISVLEE